jgi:hypothetical protein
MVATRSAGVAFGNIQRNVASAQMTAGAFSQPKAEHATSHPGFSQRATGTPTTVGLLLSFGPALRRFHLPNDRPIRVDHDIPFNGLHFRPFNCELRMLPVRPLRDWWRGLADRPHLRMALIERRCLRVRVALATPNFLRRLQQAHRGVVDLGVADLLFRRRGRLY